MCSYFECIHPYFSSYKIIIDITNEYFADDMIIFLNAYTVSRIHPVLAHTEDQPRKRGIHFLVC